MSTTSIQVPGLTPSLLARVLSWYRRNATLNLLHVLNDGYQSLLLWMLPLIAAGLHLAPDQIGRITSVHFLMGVVTAVPAARLAHRLGDEVFLLGAAGLTGLALVGMALLSGTWGLWTLMLLTGCAFGVFHPVAFGLISERAESAERAESLGWFAAIGDVGRVAVAGPGMLLAGWCSWRELAGLAGAAALALVGAGAVSLRGRWTGAGASPLNEAAPSMAAPSMAAPSMAASGSGPSTGTAHLLRSPRMARITLSGILDSMSAMGLTVFLPFVLTERALSSRWMAVMVAMFSAGSMLGKLLSGGVSRRLGVWRSLLGFQVLTAGVLAAIWASSNLVLLAFLSLTAGALSRSCLPLVLAETAESVPEARRREAFGLNQMLLGAAMSASPVLLGAVASRWASGAALGACAAICGVNVLLASTAPGVFFPETGRR